MIPTSREWLHRVDSGHSQSVSPLRPPRQVRPFAHSRVNQRLPPFPDARPEFLPNRQEGGV
jgi:hypothetical protein